MALRVLLADNSETIKKVIQLTLQDFAIDLRVVTLGVDVLDVALQFKPDIIFVDILLQKKSGYEVSKELKNNVQLKNVPVVLMWSGFMEFDEPKAKESLADARLEKPFDAETLKGLVTKLVKKQEPGANDIANFLDFPTSTTTKALPPNAIPKPQKHEDPLKSLDKIKSESEKFNPHNLKNEIPQEKFKPIELPDLDSELDSNNFTKAGEDEFEMQPLDKTTGFGYRPTPEPAPGESQTKSFILNLPEDTNVDDIPLDLQNGDNIEDMSFLLNSESVKAAEPKKSEAPKRAEPPPPPPAPTQAAPAARSPIPSAPTSINVKPLPPKAPPPVAAPASPAAPTATAAQTPIPTLEDIERIVREEVREAIEKAVWQVVPEMASQIIKKELDRLLGDKDNDTKA